MQDGRDLIIKLLTGTFIGVVCLSAGLCLASRRQPPRRWVVVDVAIPVRMPARPRYYLPQVQGSSAFDAAIMAQSNPVSSIRTTSLP